MIVVINPSHRNLPNHNNVRMGLLLMSTTIEYYTVYSSSTIAIADASSRFQDTSATVIVDAEYTV